MDLMMPSQNWRHLNGIWATFDRSQLGYYAKKHNQTLKLTNFHVIFLTKGGYFSYDAI